MEDMESLLIPQISMDVDDTPLNLEESQDNGEELTGNNDSDNEENIQNRLRNLMELENFDPAQTPEKLTSPELEAKERLFSEGHPPIEYVRMHCSSCNCHLGTAPLNQDNRYIHPLLNVLVCKNCYEFYCSGDFEKDEDGSELYCRWCGQGGKVMCCSGCAYVFCQRCVRQNLGKRTLDLIIESDDWYCFACNPSQLVNLRILCATLFDYVKQEIREVKQSGEIDRLKRDFSMCCSNKSVQQKYAMPVRKRRRAPSDDQTYHPSRDKDLMENRKANNMLKRVLNNGGGGGGTNKPLPPLQKGGATLTVMQSPPPLVGIGGSTVNIRFQSAPRTLINTPTTTTGGGSIIARGFPPIHPRPPPHLHHNTSIARPPLSAKPAHPHAHAHNPHHHHQLLPTGRPITANTVTHMASTLAHQLSSRGSQNFIPLTNNNNNGGSTTAIVRVVNAANQQIANRRVTSLPTHFPPGLRNNWFNQAATITSTIVARLSTSLVDLSNEQSNATSVEQLATVHNKLQELLSSSVNSMIQVRKNLRNEFLNDLNKMRFTAVPKQTNNNLVRKMATAAPPRTKIDDTLNPQQTVIVDDDDDVIIVNNDEDPLAIHTAPSVAVVDTPPTTTTAAPSVVDIAQSVVDTAPSVVDAAPSVVDVAPSVVDASPSVVNIAPSVVEEGVVMSALKIKVKTDLFKCAATDGAVKVEEVEEVCDEAPIEVGVGVKDDELADVDRETRLQIQHALAESRLEAVIEENSKYKVDTSEICPEELGKILTVRVVLATQFSPVNAVVGRRRRWRVGNGDDEMGVGSPPKVSSVDFEEILHGNLINTEKPLFDEAFSSFVERNKSGELVEDEGEVEGDGEGKVDVAAVGEGVVVDGGEGGVLDGSDGKMQVDR